MTKKVLCEEMLILSIHFTQKAFTVLILLYLTTDATLGSSVCLYGFALAVFFGHSDFNT